MKKSLETLWKGRTSGYSRSPNIVSSGKTATSQLEWPHLKVSPGLPARVIALQAGKKTHIKTYITVTKNT